MKLYTKILIGMVHTMQAPQDRHCMKQDVLQPDGEIQQQDAEEQFQPGQPFG